MAAIETAVRECPDIMECNLMSGDADYLFRVVAADTADYERANRLRLCVVLILAGQHPDLRPSVGRAGR